MPNTRERLLDAALELFAQHGFEGTSLRQIGAEVGVRNSAIYAHFESKQQMFDALMDSAGLLDLRLLGFGDEVLAQADPAVVLPDLVQRIMLAFDAPRARCFASVMMREGLFGAAAGSRSLAESVAEVQAQLHEPVRVWSKAGLLRRDVDPEHLVWELLAPLAQARFVYLHAQASEADRRRGIELAAKHAQFFVTCCVQEGEAAADGPGT
ncbi:TetR/AcrR family transcriptional regulator [Streptomyces sulphureus]|uniref:TetR/AcrR family transcriptional regulator n=1 Tax=Streptomyces sulphureus TaxID=47758 RepID=UPI0003629227|nr:TetR/AcrR family transcriptional regulator [Streptomyces sulphureus]